MLCVPSNSLIRLTCPPPTMTRPSGPGSQLPSSWVAGELPSAVEKYLAQDWAWRSCLRPGGAGSGTQGTFSLCQVLPSSLQSTSPKLLCTHLCPRVCFREPSFGQQGCLSQPLLVGCSLGLPTEEKFRPGTGWGCHIFSHSQGNF